MLAPLHINRAKMQGRITRDELGEIFGSVATKLPPLSPDELLFVPKLHATAKLRRGIGKDLRFADAIASELISLVNEAAYNPLGRSSARAYRFSSLAVFHAWLIGRWLDEGNEAVQSILQAIGGPQHFRSWLRHDILNNGPTLPTLVQMLWQQGRAFSFIRTLFPDDIKAAHSALAQSFGFIQNAIYAHPTHTSAAKIAQKKERQSDPIQQAYRQAASISEWSQLRPDQRQFLLLILDIAARPSIVRSDDYFFRLQLLAYEVPSSLYPTLPLSEEQKQNTAKPLFKKQAKAINRAEKKITAPPFIGQHPQKEAKLSADEKSHLSQHQTELAAKPPTLSSPAFIQTEQPFDIALPEIKTQYGGMAFLINALLALDLYPDFTRPLGSRLSIAPLRLIDRIAMRWFGTGYIQDDMHKLLRTLSCDGTLPSVWRVKPEWLDTFANNQIDAIVTNGRRITHWHEAGFPLHDRPLRKKDENLARPNAQKILPSSFKARWIACLALYLDARIKRATGTMQLGMDALAIPAIIKVQAQQIDWTFALEDLPIEFRLAGLDRNPGWLPAEGRNIAFHFQ